MPQEVRYHCSTKFTATDICGKLARYAVTVHDLALGTANTGHYCSACWDAMTGLNCASCALRVVRATWQSAPK